MDRSGIQPPATLVIGEVVRLCQQLPFTRRHGSWLNLVEAFLGRPAKTILPHLRVGSKAERKTRAEQDIDELNAEPVVFHWKHRPDAVTDA